MSLVTSRFGAPRRCPVCGEQGGTCGGNGDVTDVVDLPSEKEKDMGELVRVKRRTETGTEYYTKVPKAKVRSSDRVANKARLAPETETPEDSNTPPEGGDQQQSPEQSSSDKPKAKGK